MDNFAELFDRLKGWPLEIYKSLNPIFKVVVWLIALSAFIPAEPVDIIALLLWGAIMAFLSQAFTSVLVLGILGVFIWLVTQVIEAVVFFVLATYLVPGIIGGIAAAFNMDATDTLFE